MNNKRIVTRVPRVTAGRDLFEGMGEPDTLSPMMANWRRLRKQVPADVLLFLRLGCYYEAFGGDARIVASILNTAVTKRQGAVMTGIPAHAEGFCVSRLIAAGWKVALAETVAEVKRYE